MTPAVSKALDLHPDIGDLPRAIHTLEEEERLAFRRANLIRTSILDDDWPQKVFAFHRLFSVPTGGDAPAQIDTFRRTLRRRLLDEEFNETMMADARNDLVETVDGLLDTIYVAIGWLIELGFTPKEVNKLMAEVHASNMTKVDSSGKPIYDDGGKVLKGEEYIKADVAGLINAFITARR